VITLTESGVESASKTAEGSWIYARRKKIDTKSPESRNRRCTYRINWEKD
jgi:hypothetical protein